MAASPSRPTPEHSVQGPATPDAEDAPPAGALGLDPGLLLFTPAQAAMVLQVPESWLRRRAAQRRVPCCFLGKHLRFSRTDLETIVTQAGTQTVVRAHRTRPTTNSRP
jgi:excisionase family DNA binding protein